MIKDRLITILRDEHIDTLPVDVTIKYLKKDGSSRVAALFAARDLDSFLKDHEIVLNDIKHFNAKEKKGRVYIDCTAQE